MAYNYNNNQAMYGGFNPQESQGSANQRGGISGNYDGSSSPYNNGAAYYEIDKRTESCVFFADSGVMLKATLVNDALSLQFCAPTVDPSTGKVKYPKENKIVTVLNREKLAALLQAVKEIFIPKTEAGEHCNFGIWTNKEHSTMLTMVSDTDGDALIIHGGITNASGGVPTKTIRFDFKEDAYGVENYNPQTGEGSPLVYRVQLYVFCKLVERAYEGSFKVSAQEIKDGCRYELHKLENDIRAILSRLGGVPSGQAPAPAYNNQATTGYFENNRMDANPVSQPMPQPVELNSFDDLPF